MDQFATGLPLLSVHDPEESGTTSLDPLGLVPLGDECQFQVVSDRERLFNVVLGAEYTDDVASTERHAKRVRVASAVAEELTFRLEVDRGAGETPVAANGAMIIELPKTPAALST